MDLACDNLPRLSGKTMCLSDNSGSAWGTLTPGFASVRVAEIDNLSSVITACNSDEGYVGKFGDRLLIFPVTQRRGILHQAEEITKNHSEDVGPGTNHGIQSSSGTPSTRATTGTISLSFLIFRPATPASSLGQMKAWRSTPPETFSSGEAESMSMSRS